MTRRRKDPLRTLTAGEAAELNRLRRSPSAPAAQAARAAILLAVGEGQSYQDAARSAGRRSGDAVSRLVTRYNREGLAALEPRHGGGRRATYGDRERQRILAEARRTPTPEADGTAAWSLSTLRDALRRAADGLPAVSTYTLWRVLRQAGYSCQRDRTWCPTGQALRKRKTGAVAVTDPDAAAKKS